MSNSSNPDISPSPSPSPPPGEAAISAREVALLLGLAPRTVYQLAAKEGLPHRRHGRRLAFYRSEVVRWRDAPERRGGSTSAGRVTKPARLTKIGSEYFK